MRRIENCPECGHEMKKQLNFHAQDVYPAEQFVYYQCESCGYRLPHSGDCDCRSCAEHRKMGMKYAR